jgi:hypothetical protein
MLNFSKKLLIITIGNFMGFSKKYIKENLYKKKLILKRKIWTKNNNILEEKMYGGERRSKVKG